MGTHLKRGALGLAAIVALASLTAAASPPASASTTELVPRLERSHTIGADVHARAQRLPGAKLAIVAGTATDVVDSFTLLSEDLFERRFVPAERGVWYAICPAGAFCAAPAPRLARPAAEHLPRRLALELALRTFLETDATAVAVALPTPRLAAVVLERSELVRRLDLPALARALREEPILSSPAWLRRAVDELTRPRTFLFLGFEPAPNGGVTWAGMPRWPVARHATP